MVPFYYILLTIFPPPKNACIQRVEIPHDSSPALRYANYLRYNTAASAGELAIAYSLTQHFSIHTTHTRVIINPVEANYLRYNTPDTVADTSRLQGNSDDSVDTNI